MQCIVDSRNSRQLEDIVWKDKPLVLIHFFISLQSSCFWRACRSQRERSSLSLDCGKGVSVCVCMRVCVRICVCLCMQRAELIILSVCFGTVSAIKECDVHIMIDLNKTSLVTVLNISSAIQGDSLHHQIMLSDKMSSK